MILFNVFDILNAENFLLSTVMYLQIVSTHIYNGYL